MFSQRRNQILSNNTKHKNSESLIWIFPLLFTVIWKNNHSFSVNRIGGPAVFTVRGKRYCNPSLYKKIWCINSMAIFGSIRTVALTAVDSNLKCLSHRILALNIHLCVNRPIQFLNSGFCKVVKVVDD